ncbi:hypothetical protein [Campylobacter sp.]|nr:hypothetical protein [Campylobacter sp.]MDU6827752.1 hypothetical protein [Campylobacter sp.]
MDLVFKLAPIVVVVCLFYEIYQNFKLKKRIKELEEGRVDEKTNK